MKNNIIAQLRKDLKQNIDNKTLENGQNFFKEKIKFYGVKSASVNRLAKQYFDAIKDKPKKQVFALCEELLKSDYNEEAWVAFEWTYRWRKEFVPSDFTVFEKWLKKYVNNWAKCDTLCNHTIGDFILQNPSFIEKLKLWTKSKNRWQRRASAVTLIIPARKGKFLKDIFEIADRLLLDKDDLVQKGYGWMLKAASEAHQKEVFDYIIKRKHQMPRTALRYALEKMPKDMKKAAMLR